MDVKRVKRPRDTNQLAKRIVDLATGDAETLQVDAKKSRAGKKGAAARAKRLPERERSEIASIAASARWKKGG